jgi:uncharacterized protein YgiM (DUF1202 family)
MGHGRSIFAALLLCGASGCVNNLGLSPEETADNRELFADEVDETAVGYDALTSSQPVGSILRVTATALNLRTGPSTSYNIILVMPNDARVELVQSAPSNGWYKIKYSSVTGWASGQYLALVSTPTTSTGSTGPDRAISRAQSGVGFSYWWGHGRWRADGPTSSTRGSCSGSCPSCSHSGSYGADCSGYVAKVWSVPSSNTELTTDAHPYSTYNFYNEQTHWRRISRDNIRRADAMVYRSDGAGHIVLYESGSPWGQSWVYEARGCSSGIGRNLRSFSSAYRTIRRAGYY